MARETGSSPEQGKEAAGEQAAERLKFERFMSDLLNQRHRVEKQLSVAREAAPQLSGSEGEERAPLPTASTARLEEAHDANWRALLLTAKEGVEKGYVKQLDEDEGFLEKSRDLEEKGYEDIAWEAKTHYFYNGPGAETPAAREESKPQPTQSSYKAKEGGYEITGSGEERKL